MHFIRRAPGRPERLGVFSGSFNPPTRAHMALAHAALRLCDEVLFVIPAAFPHKQFEAATLEQRLEMLERCIAGNPSYSLGVTDGGLFIEIARECRVHYPDTSLSFLCGRDAAERILHWDYGSKGTVGRMLAEFHLIVAPRRGGFEAPPEVRHAIQQLDLADYDEHSSTAVREGREGAWEELVPAEITELVRSIYHSGSGR